MASEIEGLKQEFKVLIGELPDEGAGKRAKKKLEN